MLRGSALHAQRVPTSPSLLRVLCTCMRSANTSPFGPQFARLLAAILSILRQFQVQVSQSVSILSAGPYPRRRLLGKLHAQSLFRTLWDP
jgi:hypothetical protein